MTKRNEVLSHFYPDEADSIEGEFVEGSPSNFDIENPYAEYQKPYEEVVVDENLTQYMNLSPIKLRELQESDDPSINQEAVAYAQFYWSEWYGPLGRGSEGIEIGEPDHGTPAKAQVVNQLRELVGKDRDPHWRPAPLSKRGRGTAGAGDLIDFDELLAEGDYDEDQGSDEDGETIEIDL